MRRLRLIASRCLLPLGLSLGLAGCGLMRPPASVQAPFPAQWNAPLPHGGSLASLADWWRQLDDPLLVELIAAAETASPNLASAAARVAEARSTRVQAGAALLPSLDGTGTASRGVSGSSFSGGGASSSSSSSSAAAATAPLTTLQAGLQSKWEIDLFGRLRADRDSAQQKLDSATAKWHDARVAVAAETANAYFAERACRQQLRVSESDAKSRSETSRLTDLSARAGFTAPADAALARASASDASGRLTQQRAQCAIQRKALVALSGIDEPTLAQKLAVSHTQRALVVMGSIQSVPAAALSQRPDVYAAELAVASASADVGSAEAERYPKLSISGSIGRMQIRTSGFRESLDTWTVGPVSLTVPLLDGGARTGQHRRGQGALHRGRVALPRERAAGGARGGRGAREPRRDRCPHHRRRQCREELPGLLRRHAGALQQRPGEPVRAGGLAPHPLHRADRARHAAARTRRSLGFAVPLDGRRLEPA
jgi:multidrug efflux system outer membrane protein